MNKLLIFLLLTIFLFGNVLALDIDNIKVDIVLSKDNTISIGEKEIIYNDLWKKYKPIQIDNIFGYGGNN